MRPKYGQWRIYKLRALQLKHLLPRTAFAFVVFERTIGRLVVFFLMPADHRFYQQWPLLPKNAGTMVSLCCHWIFYLLNTVVIK